MPRTGEEAAGRVCQLDSHRALHHRLEAAMAAADLPAMRRDGNDDKQCDVRDDDNICDIITHLRMSHILNLDMRMQQGGHYRFQQGRRRGGRQARGRPGRPAGSGWCGAAAAAVAPALAGRTPPPTSAQNLPDAPTTRKMCTTSKPIPHRTPSRCTATDPGPLGSLNNGIMQPSADAQPAPSFYWADPGAGRKRELFQTRLPWHFLAV